MYDQLPYDFEKRISMYHPAEKCKLAPAGFPNFLVPFLPKCLRFVRKMKKNFAKSSEDQLYKFAQHLLICFYLEHGEVKRIDCDLDSLLNENKEPEQKRDA